MNYTKQAIQKAIEGGYDKNADILESGSLVTHCPDEVIFLDPSFWQALGKALGWRNSNINLDKMAKNGNLSVKGEQNDWIYHWHRFIDHLAQNKDPDEFFKELLR